MKISRELQRDKLNAEGLAPTRLVVSWEGQRPGTGCLVSPAHWDAKARLVKVQPGTQHSSINPLLTAASNAADEAAELAHRQQRLLPEVELRAASEAAVKPSPVAASLLPAPATDFDSLQVRWIGRKTFVTLKLYQGVPQRIIKQATGHQTEEAFNHYVGVDELRLAEEFMRKSTRRRRAA